jgi:hypothetical protein
MLKSIKKVLAGCCAVAMLATSALAVNASTIEAITADLGTKLSLAQVLAETDKIKAGTVEVSMQMSFEDETLGAMNCEVASAGIFNGTDFADTVTTLTMPSELSEIAITMGSTSVIKDNVMYLNPAVYIDMLNQMSGLVEADETGAVAGIYTLITEVLTAADKKTGWIEFPLGEQAEISEDALAAAQSLNDVLTDVLVKAVLDNSAIVTEEDDVYTITIADDETFAELIGSFITELETAKDDIISGIEALTDLTPQLTVDNDVYGEIAMDTIKAICDTLGITYTDDDFVALADFLSGATLGLEILDDVEIPTQELSLEEAFDTLLEALYLAYDEVSLWAEEDHGDNEFAFTYSVSLEGEEGSRVANQTLNWYVTDMFSIYVSVAITEDDSVIVSAPEKSSTIPVAVANYLEAVIETGLIDVAMFEGLTLDVVIDQIQVMLNSLITGDMWVDGPCPICDEEDCWYDCLVFTCPICGEEECWFDCSVFVCPECGEEECYFACIEGCPVCGEEDWLVCWFDCVDVCPYCGDADDLDAFLCCYVRIDGDDVVLCEFCGEEGCEGECLDIVICEFCGEEDCFGDCVDICDVCGNVDCDILHGDVINDWTADDWANIEVSPYRYLMVQGLRTEEAVGDFNGDGKVTIKDLLFLQKYIANPENYELADEEIEALDQDGDGEVDVIDYLIFVRVLCGYAD